MAIRVLFVDDEPNILQGLRRMLRGMRGQWEMDFAEGGEAALAKLAERPVDAVVTDMRMPGMDGSALLDRLAEKYPGTVRFVLSGEADREATFRTVGVSHQFLPKPCNTEALAEKISKCLTFRDALSAPSYRTAVSALTGLPTAPSVFASLSEALSEEAPSLGRVADLFASDPGLTAKALQLANSAYFGVGQGVGSASQAVKLLGLDVLRPLVQDYGLAAPFADDGPVADAYARACAAAETVAEASATVARQRGADDDGVDRARVAGQLHNLGRLALCAGMPDAYRQALVIVESEGLAIDEAERQVFGQPHSVFGAYLASLWGLPDVVAGAIAALDHDLFGESGLSDRLPDWIESCIDVGNGRAA